MENASFEMETRRSEFDDNRKRMEVLTKENNELIKRIMEMKEEQAKQMNQVNDVYHTVIQSAKSAELEAQSRLESIKRQAARVAQQASTSAGSAAAAGAGPGGSVRTDSPSRDGLRSLPAHQL